MGVDREGDDNMFELMSIYNKTIRFTQYNRCFDGWFLHTIFFQALSSTPTLGDGCGCVGEGE